jgi:hypothetical protein
MGSQSTKIVIMARDAEFDDTIAYNYFNIILNLKFLQYIIGSLEKFTSNKIHNKDLLNKTFNLPLLSSKSFDNYFINNNSIDFHILKEQLKFDLNKLYNLNIENIFTLDLLITTQASMLIEIINELISDSILLLSDINIYIMCTNYTSKNMFDALLKLKNLCFEYNINFIVHEFNPYLAMGYGHNLWYNTENTVKCESSNVFINKLFQIKNTNDIANNIVQYATEYNKLSVTDIKSHISNDIILLNNLHIDNYLADILTDINVYLQSTLDHQLLKIDFINIINMFNDIYKSLDNSNVRKNEITSLTKNLSIWYNDIIKLLNNNMSLLSMNAISLPLMYMNNKTFDKYQAYATKKPIVELLPAKPSNFNSNYINIVSNKPECEYIEVIHYVAKKPEYTLYKMEKIAMNMITF